LTVRMIIKFDCENVVLSGGSFQNNILYNSVRDRLEKLGLKVFRNRQVPMNDNGIALLIEKIQDKIRIDVVPEVKEWP